MSPNKSSVNFRNLLKDLADMYPYDVSEVVLVELIANSLDAKASRIDIFFDNKEKILTVNDNGKGMNREQFEEYHDFAAGLKIKGTGIGFAGVGAKISFNISDRVLTETVSKDFKGSSDWYWNDKYLEWVSKENSLKFDNGTLVKVFFKNKTNLSYCNFNDIKNILYKHYLPLFDNLFLNLYDSLGIYSKNLRFFINNEVCDLIDIKKHFRLEKIKEFFLERKGKKYGYGFFGLVPNEYPLSNTPGILLCTYGKVIKSEIFNYYLTDISHRIFGVVEIPELVKFLTTAKNDLNSRLKPKEYESLIDPVRENFKKWLKEDCGVESISEVKGDDIKKIEKELKKIMEEIPELKEFFGGIFKKKVIVEAKNGEISISTSDKASNSYPDISNESSDGEGSLFPMGEGNSDGKANVENKEDTKRGTPIGRSSRIGPKITFMNVADRQEISWVEGDKIYINIGHPSYLKVKNNSFAKIIYFLLCIGLALEKFKNVDLKEISLIEKIFLVWGKHEK